MERLILRYNLNDDWVPACARTGKNSRSGKRSVDVGKVKDNPPAADKKEVALCKP
jgi:hypothetical protein